MEHSEATITPDPASGPTFHITRYILNNWTATSQWALLMAILGLIYVVFNAWVILTSGDTMDAAANMSASFSASPTLSFFFQNLKIISIGSTVLMAAMFVFHLLFALQMRRAAANEQQNTFDSAMSNLLQHFRIYGVLLIVSIVIYFALIVQFINFYRQMMGFMPPPSGGGIF